MIRNEILSTSSGEEILSLLQNMKESQQEAVFSLGKEAHTVHSFWEVSVTAVPVIMLSYGLKGNYFLALAFREGTFIFQRLQNVSMMQFLIIKYGTRNYV